MACLETIPNSSKQFVHSFYEKAMRQRIPLSGSIEFTYRCNLKCVHCYLGPQSDLQRRRADEMNTRRWLSVIDEITEAGCLYLLITGGEPLIRKDFIDIYRHAKSNGLLVTVFTNGTLLSERILELFENLPPQTVEISLYGASPETYERITCVRGSFVKCLGGIQRLLEYGVDVRLKTVLMTLNHHELTAMERMAKDLGVKFRLDPAIFPRLDGDKDTLDLRVSPEDAVEYEFGNPERASEWEGFVKRFKDAPTMETLYSCSAGLTGFHIDAEGILKPCLMTPTPEFDLSLGTFTAGWQEIIPEILERKAGRDFLCNDCDNSIMCGYCPAFFGLETGSETNPSKYICALGRYRSKKIYGKI